MSSNLSTSYFDSFSLILALCCSKNIVAKDRANITEKESKDEVDKLEDIHIIEFGDAKCFW